VGGGEPGRKPPPGVLRGIQGAQLNKFAFGLLQARRYALVGLGALVSNIDIGFAA